jgi:hypothetical protein
MGFMEKLKLLTILYIHIDIVIENELNELRNRIKKIVMTCKGKLA